LKSAFKPEVDRTKKMKSAPIQCPCLTHSTRRPIFQSNVKAQSDVFEISAVDQRIPTTRMSFWAENPLQSHLFARLCGESDFVAQVLLISNCKNGDLGSDAQTL
jgi:hypothetical protein